MEQLLLHEHATSHMKGGLYMRGNSVAKHVHIEGPIAAGKSTFLQLLSTCATPYDFFQGNQRVEGIRNMVTVAQEPITRWMTTPGPNNENGESMLDLLYKDPVNQTFPFQLNVFSSMYARSTEELYNYAAKSSAVVANERSIHSARWVFTEAGVLVGNISPGQLSTIHDQYLRACALETTRSQTPDLIVYMRTTAERSYARMMRRGRQAEMTLRIEYLRMIIELHEGWLIEERFGRVRCPILVVDVDRDDTALTALYQILATYIASGSIFETINACNRKARFGSGNESRWVWRSNAELHIAPTTTAAFADAYTKSVYPHPPTIGVSSPIVGDALAYLKAGGWRAVKNSEDNDDVCSLDSASTMQKRASNTTEPTTTTSNRDNNVRGCQLSAPTQSQWQRPPPLLTPPTPTRSAVAVNIDNDESIVTTDTNTNSIFDNNTMSRRRAT